MGDLISRKAVMKFLSNKNKDGMPEGAGNRAVYSFIENLIDEIRDDIPDAHDSEYELRLLNNYLYNRSKAYRQRTQNYTVVRDLLMRGTSTAGMTSCIMKCHELGIDPYGYDMKGAVKDENHMQS